MKNNFWGAFLPALLLVFIILKLTGIGVVASWSWWWVLSPIWAPFAITTAIALVCLVAMGIIDVFGKNKK